MSNELSVSYYSIQDICEEEDLNFICKKIYELLSKNHLSTIQNAFISNTRVASNGILYFRIKGLAYVLRTGASNYFVYQGVDGVLAPAEIISIDGEEYISGSTLAGLLDYRISTTLGRTKEYLKYSRQIYQTINELEKINSVRTIYLQDIEACRKKMKKARIDAYGITACEFSGVKFSSNSEVEFAHIQSVITSPHLASDINNGVIILKKIHAELTSLNIHDFQGMYNYCIENEFSTEWANG